MAAASRPTVLRLGTRGGELALWQAREAARLIVAVCSSVTLDIHVVRTSGDRVRSVPVAEIGGSGVFTRELEQALSDGRIDLAVHSLKDLPTRLAAGLTLGAVLERADPRDALVAPAGTRLDALAPGARVGTSSPRRRAQVLARRPDLRTLDLRGNVPTRLAKLDRGEYDAVVLACAGLHRLGLAARVAEVLDPEVMMPAPGQGALAIEARADHDEVLGILRAVEHRPTRLATAAERACMARLGGGCQAPAGALATFAGDSLALAAVVASSSGDRAVRERLEAVVTAETDAEALGERLGERLLRQGADAILAGIRSAAGGDRA